MISFNHLFSVKISLTFYFLTIGWNPLWSDLTNWGWKLCCRKVRKYKMKSFWVDMLEWDSWPRPGECLVIRTGTAIEQRQFAVCILKRDNRTLTHAHIRIHSSRCDISIKENERKSSRIQVLNKKIYTLTSIRGLNTHSEGDERMTLHPHAVLLHSNQMLNCTATYVLDSFCHCHTQNDQKWILLVLPPL